MAQASYTGRKSCGPCICSTPNTYVAIGHATHHIPATIGIIIVPNRSDISNSSLHTLSSHVVPIFSCSDCSFQKAFKDPYFGALRMFWECIKAFTWEPHCESGEKLGTAAPCRPPSGKVCLETQKASKSLEWLRKFMKIIWFYMITCIILYPIVSTCLHSTWHRDTQHAGRGAEKHWKAQNLALFWKVVAATSLCRFAIFKGGLWCWTLRARKANPGLCSAKKSKHFSISSIFGLKKWQILRHWSCFWCLLCVDVR